VFRRKIEHWGMTRRRGVTAGVFRQADITEWFRKEERRSDRKEEVSKEKLGENQKIIFPLGDFAASRPWVLTQ
jgi:hypothetical protein